MELIEKFYLNVYCLHTPALIVWLTEASFYSLRVRSAAVADLKFISPQEKQQ
jgi:hypothetical protein